MTMTRRDDSTSVSAVFELREAAVEYGKAVAQLDRERTPEARDAVLETHVELEVKTAAAIDECAEKAEWAVEEATGLAP
jgi:hypothetical protein